MDNKNIELDKIYIPTLMSEINNEFLKNRLEHVLYTYSKRALFYKHAYYGLTFATIVLPTLVPVVYVFSGKDFSSVQFIVSLLSAFSAISAGILATANIRDNWISYRSNCELLKEEVFQYLMKAGEYHDLDDEGREQCFINQLSKLYREETIVWKKNSSPGKNGDSYNASN